MTTRVLGIAAGSIISLVGLISACSDDNSNSTGSSGATADGGWDSSASSDSSGSSGDGGEESECVLPDGTYTVKFTTKTGGTGPNGTPCPDVPERAVALLGSKDKASLVLVKHTRDFMEQGIFGTKLQGGSCAGLSSCEGASWDCTGNDVPDAGQGPEAHSYTKLTTTDGKATGTHISTIFDADGNESACTYNFEWTKKEL